MDVFKTLIHSQPGAAGSTVAITGGSINGTNIGATTPGTGAFTTVSATGEISSQLVSAGMQSASASSDNFCNFSSDIHGGTMVSSNVYRDTNTYKIAQTHASLSGMLITTPGASQADQGEWQLFATAPASVTAGATYTGTKAFAASSTRVSIPLTTASTSTTTGALVVSGGVGVAGAGYFGGNVWIGEAGNLAPNTVDKYIGVSVTSTADFPAHVLSVTDGVKNVRGSQFIDASTTQERWIWDVGYSSASNVSYEWRIGASQKMLLRETGGLSISDTTASTSTTTGALQVAGGVGVAGSGYFGGTLNSVGVISSTGSNAALQLYDRSAGAADAWLLSATGGSTFTFVNNGNSELSIAKGGNVTVRANLTVSGTTASTSTTTGALVISGGVGIAGAANVGTYYGMVDGVTAPGATVGYAKIYVDTADGDLKVVFGDGTIKTIATDT